MTSRLLTPVITLCLCGLLYFVHSFASLSDTVLDFLFQIRGSIETSQSIVIIGIDEDTLDSLGAWPFAREIHGTLLKQLAPAKVIGFDLLFSEPTDEDGLFNKAIKLAPPVVFTAALDYTHNTLTPASSLYNFRDFGHINSILGNSGIIRKTRLHQNNQLDNFSLVMLKAGGKPVTISNLSSPKLINFYGPEFTFLYLSYIDVLRGTISPEFFQDRFVLVGAQALGLGDVHVTPFTENHPMPGVEIQATILNNLLDASFLTELPYISWTLTTVFFFMSVFLWPTTSEKRNMVVNTTGVLVPVAASIFLFNYNIFLDPSTPLLFLVVSYLVHLSLQGLWITKKLITEVTELDHELETGLHKIYTNIPRQLIPPTKDTSAHKLLTGGLRRHINRMHDGVGALTLQNHFINHLLKEEVDPLILWEINSDKVILANSMFNRFWRNRFDDSPPLPGLHQFLALLENQKISDDISTPNNEIDFRSSDKIWSIDISLQHQGRTFYYKVNMHGVETAQSRFSGVLASVTDVTEIHELERMKSDLLGIVSHELKLPLTTILGYSEMLTDMLEDEPKQYAREISTQTKRLNQLIENFLDLTRIESGQYTIRKIPFDLSVVILDAVNGVSHMADQKRITIDVDIPAKVTPIVGDEPLLLQAIINLLDNSVKFSLPSTSVRVKLIEGKDNFTLKITDQGPGIAPKDQEAIFDKFNRGSNKATPQGFGLGLSLVKQVIDSHNGSITILSTPENGTTFHIILPKS